MQKMFFEFGIIYFLSIIVPGPSVFLVLKNGMVHSKPSGIFSSIGIMFGIALQSGAVLLGTYFLQDNANIFFALKILCSGYLFYLGGRSLFFKSDPPKFSIQKNPELRLKKSYGLDFLLQGLLLELLNPLALAFFISILSLHIHVIEIGYYKFLLWLEIIILGSLWFCGMALIVTSQFVTRYLNKLGKKLERLSGCIFIILSLRMLLI